MQLHVQALCNLPGIKLSSSAPSRVLACNGAKWVNEGLPAGGETLGACETLSGRQLDRAQSLTYHLLRPGTVLVGSLVPDPCNHEVNSRSEVLAARFK